MNTFKQIVLSKYNIVDIRKHPDFKVAQPELDPRKRLLQLKKEEADILPFKKGSTPANSTEAITRLADHFKELKQINDGKIERIIPTPTDDAPDELAIEIQFKGYNESSIRLFYIGFEQGQYTLYGFPERDKKKLATLGPNIEGILSKLKKLITNPLSRKQNVGR